MVTNLQQLFKSTLVAMYSYDLFDGQDEFWHNPVKN